MLLSLENATARKRVGDFAAIDMFVEAGFTGMDYSFFNEPKDWEKCFGTPDVFRKMGKIRRYAEEKGLVLCQSHAPFRFREGMEMNESEYEYHRVVRSMELAAALGIPMIVIHSVMTADNLNMLDFNERYYNSLLPYAERFGIKIAVENLTGRRNAGDAPTVHNLGTPELFKEMQDRLHSPLIVGCLDIGHANLTYHDTPSFIRQCKGYVQYIHTHDNDGFHDCHLLPALGDYFDECEKPGDGSKKAANPNSPYTLPWDEVLNALREIGYDGPFNLELPRYQNCFTTEDLPLALKLAVQVGRRMMAEFGQG